MNTVYLEPANSGYSHQTLRLAVAAYLARYKGESRSHSESDLRISRSTSSAARNTTKAKTDLGLVAVRA